MKKKFVVKTSFFSDLKKFLIKGNALELAFAVVVGAAFSKITTSLVADIIMPPFGLLLGGVNFTELVIVLKEAVVVDGVVTAEAVAIKYGLLIQAIIEFLIIGFTVFVVLRIVKRITSIKFQTREEARQAAKKLEEEKAAAKAKEEAEKEEKRLAAERAVSALEADIRSEELLKQILEQLKALNSGEQTSKKTKKT